MKLKLDWGDIIMYGAMIFSVLIAASFLDSVIVLLFIPIPIMLYALMILKLAVVENE